MFKEGCPGSAEIRTPSPEEIICFWCDARNEIWSDESEMKCKNCGKEITSGYEAVLYCVVSCSKGMCRCGEIRTAYEGNDKVITV